MSMRFQTLFLPVLGALSLASTVLAEDLDSRLTAWRQETGVQGVAVAIYDGRNAILAVSGNRTEGGAALEPDDSFSIASVSKTFTAAAILVLADQGRLGLSDSAARLSGLDLPASVSVDQLLHHASGLPEYMGGALSFEVFLREHSEGRESWPVDQVRAFAVASAPETEPAFQYSNANYVVLGAIIERQTGLPLAQALDALIFQPEALASARLIRTSQDDPDALGHSEALAGMLGSAQLDERLNRELATAGDAAGGIAINAADLARWAHDYFSGAFVAGLDFEPPLGGEAFGLTGDVIAIGPGSYQVSYGDQILRLHGGDGLGITALAAYAPATGRSIAILVNDDTVHALGFGEDGYLDALVRDLLAD
ncbi:serine hydrolase domain-containing protein [uncultured Maricaulis sp.]|uniref:serine hydrolase domain-containing protein n=1 Tax=uncultured Maricaulis sp. TaxID=174710 RepID=UPI0030D77BCA|tara:strand:- start:46962 stop:48065 length:1104 start_codon:yes stop_codon:yes gene_type:complete